MNQIGNFRACAMILVLVVAAARVGWGQAPAQQPDHTVTGTGMATLERQPDAIRMTIDVRAEGKDITDALAKLRAGEGELKQKLVNLGANQASISPGPVRDASVKTPRQQQMEMMMRQRGRAGAAGARKPTTAPAAPTVKLVATLMAEWSLSGNGDDRLAGAWSLVEKIKSADLAAKKDAAAALTPEQQEEMEEQQAMAVQMGTTEEGGADPGAPKFAYVARLSDEDQAKLAADAFGKAKAHAARLAKAAGSELGGLRQLNGQAISAPSAQDDPYSYQMRAMNMRTGMGVGDGSLDEAIGSEPSRIEVRMTVTASFSLK